MTNHQLHLDRTTPVDDLKFEHISEKYKSVQMTSAALAYCILAGLALLLLLDDSIRWCILAECLILTVFAFNMAILRNAHRYRGYAMREHDISYRRGVILPRTTTVPYSRIQQVSIAQNPVSKFFKLYSVGIDNGAQAMSSLTIPGLTEETAKLIKNSITDKLRDSNE